MYTRQRWHNFPPGFLSAQLSNGFTPKLVELDNDIHLQFGEECCSKSSIAFHNIKKELMYQIDAYLYRCVK